MATTLALIGAGSIGQRHLQAMAQSNRVRICAVVDPNPAAASIADRWKVPFFSDVATMLSTAHPQGAIVATPTEHHLAPSLALLQERVPVLIEKPIASTENDASRIVEASAARKCPVLVAHQRRYYPQVDAAKEIIRSGQIGKLVGVSGQWAVRKHDDYYSPDWRKRWPAGPVLTNLVHEIDTLRHICGPIDALVADTSHMVLGYEKEDAAACLIRFSSGALGTFLLSDQADSPWSWEQSLGENALFPRTQENSVRFMGTDGALDFPNLRHWLSQGEPQWMTPMACTVHDQEPVDAYVRQLDHFADVIAGAAPPKISAQDGATTLRTTLAILKSAEAGTWINLGKAP